MKYTWQVWRRYEPTGWHSDWAQDPRRGYTEAASPDDLVAKLGLALAEGERLVAWDTHSVGVQPVVKLDGPK